MREISFERKPDALPIQTVINYGDTGTGKTTWAATWPRVFAIVDAIERGYESIITSDRSTWFEPDGPEPVIVAIESIEDLAKLCEQGGRIDQEIARGRCETIVFDAFSYYCELALAHILKLQGGKNDNRAAYGDLGKHLRAVRGMVHLKGKSVIWNCLAKHPSDDDKRGMPLVPGKQGEMWPGAVDFVLRSRLDRRSTLVEIVGEDGKPTGQKERQISETFYMNTRTDGPWLARNRLGAQGQALLPDPFIGTYTDFITALGYDVEALRARLKKPQAMTAKPSVVVKPVVSTPRVVTATPQANNKR